MSNTLISCVGRRDPYDNDYPFFYGSLLASAHYININFKKLKKIVLIYTPEYLAKINEINNYLQSYFPDCEIQQLETKLNDPSNLNLVDSEFKIILEDIARDTSHKSTFINLSSGTQQMTQTLTLMLVTGFIKETGLSTKNPFYKSNCCDLELTDEPLKEPLQNVLLRVEKLNKIDIPAVKHITKSNIITLIKNDNYKQAEILLEEFPDSEVKNKILKPIFEMANNLLLLDVTTAKLNFKELVEALKQMKLYDFYITKILSIENAINCHTGLLCYWLTEIRNRQERYDDFIRSVGLTREICLELQLKNSEFSFVYESVLDKSNKTYKIKTNELKRLYPNLFNSCFNNKVENLNIVSLASNNVDYFNSNSQQNFNQKNKLVNFNNKTMLEFLNFAASHTKDEKLIYIVNVFHETKQIVQLRNDYSHSFKKVSQNDIQIAKKVFENLKSVLPGYNKNGSGGSIFKFIRELTIDIIRYRFN